jgi:hypothetical protein
MEYESLPFVQKHIPTVVAGNDKGVTAVLGAQCRRGGRCFTAFLVILFVYIISYILYPFLPMEGGLDADPQAGSLVPLEAHIMSKCPDARVGLTFTFWLLPTDESLGLLKANDFTRHAASKLQSKLHVIVYRHVRRIFSIIALLASLAKTI